MSFDELDNINSFALKRRFDNLELPLPTVHVCFALDKAISERGETVGDPLTKTVQLWSRNE